MTRLLPFALLCVSIWVAHGLRAGEPVRDDNPTGTALPVGKWKVEFSHGVKEECNIGNGGESSVVEPQRRSMGMAEAREGSIVITFNDDRIERWTPVGNRFVVEHWFPGSRVPIVTPVLGIAERAP